jgi:hypothetical protein
MSNIITLLGYDNIRKSTIIAESPNEFWNGYNNLPKIGKKQTKILIKKKVSKVAIKQEIVKIVTKKHSP